MGYSSYKNEYNNLYKGKISNLDVLFDKALKRGNRFFDLIKKLGILDMIDSVYESGCATGANLYPFYLENKSVSGFDYDDYLLNYGRNRGLQISNIDEDKEIVEEKYDLIISSHVIEHVQDPIKFINLIYKILKPDGKMILGTPDFDSGCARYFGDKYRLLHDPTHISLFSNESMFRFLRDNNFKIFNVHYPFFETRYFNKNNLLSLLDRNGVSPPFYGNFMTFFCKK